MKLKKSLRKRVKKRESSEDKGKKIDMPRSMLENYRRYQELSGKISDDDVFQYVSPKNDAQTRVMKLLNPDYVDPLDVINTPDIAGNAILLHEKEEIFQLLERGYKLKEILDNGGNYNPAYKEAHIEALKVEFNFLKSCASSLGFELSIEALGAASPTHLIGGFSDFYDYDVLNKRVVNLKDYGLFNIKPTREEVGEAMKFYRKCGSEYKFSLEQIYSFIKVL